MTENNGEQTKSLYSFRAKSSTNVQVSNDKA